jgi:hypothetical protein
MSSVIRIQRLAMFLEAQFGEVEQHESGEEHQDPLLLVQLDDADAQINLVSLVWFIDGFLSVVLLTVLLLLYRP